MSQIQLLGNQCNRTMHITIRWFLPSWLQMKTGNKVIYIDPAWIQKNFDSHPTKIIYSHYPEPMDGLPEKDMAIGDVILITHHHQDHIKTATVNRLADENTTIISPEKCRDLIGRRFESIKPDDTKSIGNIGIQAVHAYNTPDGHSTRKQHHKGECVGYVITVNGKSIYHAGDTVVVPEMKELKDIDVAFLPIGGTFTMDIEEAVEATKIIKPRTVIPMHYLHAKPEEFKKKAEKETKSQVRVLSIGESLEL